MVHIQSLLVGLGDGETLWVGRHDHGGFVAVHHEVCNVHEGRGGVLRDVVTLCQQREGVEAFHGEPGLDVHDSLGELRQCGHVVVDASLRLRG